MASRHGDVDVDLSGTHLAQVQLIDDDDFFEGPFESLSLYRTSAGRYVIAYSGKSRRDWASGPFESPAEVLEALQDRDGFPAEPEKLLLVEAGKRNAGIDTCARLDLRADSVRDLIHSVKNASKIIDSTHLSDHVRRIEASIYTDPAQAIGSAKEMIESVAKAVLGHYNSDVKTFESLGQRVGAAFKCLNLSMDDIPDAARGAEHLKSKRFLALSRKPNGESEREYPGTQESLSNLGWRELKRTPSLLLLLASGAGPQRRLSHRRHRARSFEMETLPQEKTIAELKGRLPPHGSYYQSLEAVTHVMSQAQLFRLTGIIGKVMVHLSGRNTHAVALDANAAAIDASSVGDDAIAFKGERAAEIIKIYAAAACPRAVHSQQRRVNVNGSGICADEYTSSISTGVVLQKAAVACVERAILHRYSSAILSRPIVTNKAV
jgi:hypothetical protein